MLDRDRAVAMRRQGASLIDICAALDLAKSTWPWIRDIPASRRCRVCGTAFEASGPMKHCSNTCRKITHQRQYQVAYRR